MLKIKTPINWMKFAEAMSSMNPYGPVIMSDGSIYSPDGRQLAPATATLDLTGPAQPRAERRPRPSVSAAPVAA
jgi:hypothetical protein